MNTANELIEEVHKVGGKIWLDGDSVRLRGPAATVDRMAPVMRAVKQEIVEALKAVSKAPSITRYQVFVDGRSLTVIDPTGKPYAEQVKRLRQRFGLRLQHIEKLS